MQTIMTRSFRVLHLNARFPYEMQHFITFYDVKWNINNSYFATDDEPDIITIIIKLMKLWKTSNELHFMNRITTYRLNNPFCYKALNVCSLRTLWYDEHCLRDEHVKF